MLEVPSKIGLIWRSPLRTNRRKLGGRNRTDRSRGHTHDESQGKPNSSTASSVLDKRQYDREISFHQLPEGDVPWYEELKRVQWDEWVDTRVSQNSFTSRGRKDSSASPQRKTFALKICISKWKRCSVGPRQESPARESESAIGHSGSALSGQCSRIGENRCSDSAPDSGEHVPSNCVIDGMGSESQGCGRVVCLSVKKILEKSKSLCSLSRLYVVS